MARASTTWKPGESGNPNGRKPSGKTMADVLRTVVNGKNRTLLTRKVLALALEGNMAAIAFIFERLDGRVAFSVEHSGAVQHHVLDLSQFTSDELVKLHEMGAEYARTRSDG